MSPFLYGFTSQFVTTVPRTDSQSFENGLDQLIVTLYTLSIYPSIKTSYSEPFYANIVAASVCDELWLLRNKSLSLQIVCHYSTPPGTNC